MYLLSIIGVVVSLLLMTFIYGFLIWKFNKEEIKQIIQLFKGGKLRLPSFKKRKVDVKNLLTDLKNNLNKK
jgi:hypothetical protein